RQVTPNGVFDAPQQRPSMVPIALPKVVNGLKKVVDRPPKVAIRPRKPLRELPKSPGVPETREYMLRGLIKDDEIGLDSDVARIAWSGAKNEVTPEVSSETLTEAIAVHTEIIQISV